MRTGGDILIDPADDEGFNEGEVQDGIKDLNAYANGLGAQSNTPAPIEGGRAYAINEQRVLRRRRLGGVAANAHTGLIMPIPIGSLRRVGNVSLRPWISHGNVRYN